MKACKRKRKEHKKEIIQKLERLHENFPKAHWKLLKFKSEKAKIQLKSVSSQCARDKSSIVRKSKVHPEFFKW